MKLGEGESWRRKERAGGYWVGLGLRPGGILSKLGLGRHTGREGIGWGRGYEVRRKLVEGGGGRG